MSTTWVNVVLALVLAVALAVPHFSTAQSDIFQFGDKRVKLQGKRQYCGPVLSDALKLICIEYASPPMSKKGGQELEIDDYNYGYDDSYPFRSRASANALMGRFGGNRFRRQGHGIRDECCAKPCSIDELSSYCSIPR